MYVERPNKAWWISAILILAVASVAFGIWASYDKSPQTFQKVVPVWVLVLALIGFAFFGMFFMEYRITNDEVQVYFPPFTYAVKKKDILRVTVSSAPWWMGVGLRIGWQRIAFTTRTGKVVEIDKKTGIFRKVLLTPNNPDDFARKTR